jgi:hypothetical protein
MLLMQPQLKSSGIEKGLKSRWSRRLCHCRTI